LERAINALISARDCSLAPMMRISVGALCTTLIRQYVRKKGGGAQSR
jgi:hypothetical protein